MKLVRQFQWFNPSGKDYDKIAADRVARGEVNYRLDFEMSKLIIAGYRLYKLKSNHLQIRFQLKNVDRPPNPKF